MEEIVFVSIEELMQPQYEKFSELTMYDKEHPLHRFYDYVVQFFGGLREDVASFFCDRENVTQLAEVIDAGQDVGLRNEWYRRLIRLLQCSAEAEWYQLFFGRQDKPQGYIQYFLNQLAGYAELGISVFKVKGFFEECSAAYLLEYKIRNFKSLEAEVGGEKSIKQCEEREECTAVEEKGSDSLEVLKNVMAPMLEGQNRIQSMLQALMEQNSNKALQNVTIEAVTEEDEADKEETVEEIVQGEPAEFFEETKLEEQAEKDKEEKPEVCQNREKYKGNAFQFAKLFQQIRIKRKSVQMRKMDHTQQLQELISRMNKEDFSIEDMKVVRNLIDKEVSLEFLYIIISEEQEAMKKLKQMYEFLTYQQEAVMEG